MSAKTDVGNERAEVTPLPWRVDRDNVDGITVVDGRGSIVWLEDWADIPDERNAESIIAESRKRARVACAAVNSHDALVKALEAVRNYPGIRSYVGTNITDAIDAALSCAKEQGGE